MSLIRAGNRGRGRPPKSRALTDILNQTLHQPVEYQGTMLSGVEVIAAMLRDYIITGKVQFPDGTVTKSYSLTDWIGAVKWIYDHIDGVAPRDVETKVEVLVVREDDAGLLLKDGD
jgi:hypothetical protein